MLLLRTILDILFPQTGAQALVSAATFESVGRYLAPTAITETTVALLPYRRPLVRALILESKFKDSEEAQQLLARVLADYLLESGADSAELGSGALVLVPIPLSAQRFAERGYNQAERISRRAAKMLPDVYLDTELLERNRHTMPQTMLGGRERRQNVADAFKTAALPDPDHTYIVLDDVVTTGATLNAAMAALQEAGAPRVFGIALAH